MLPTRFIRPAAGYCTDCQLSLSALTVKYLSSAVGSLRIHIKQLRSGEDLPSSKVAMGTSFGLAVLVIEMLGGVR